MDPSTAECAPLMHTVQSPNKIIEHLSRPIDMQTLAGSEGATENFCETGIIGTIKNAGVENAGPSKQLWKAKTPAGLELTLLLVVFFVSSCQAMV